MGALPLLPTLLKSVFALRGGWARRVDAGGEDVGEGVNLLLGDSARAAVGSGARGSRAGGGVGSGGVRVGADVVELVGVGKSVGDAGLRERGARGADVRGVGGEARDGIRGGDGGDLVHVDRHAGRKRAAVGAGAENGHQAGGGVGSGSGVAANGVEIDLVAVGAVVVLVGDGEAAVGSGEDVVAAVAVGVGGERSGVDVLQHGDGLVGGGGGDAGTAVGRGVGLEHVDVRALDGLAAAVGDSRDGAGRGAGGGGAEAGGAAGERESRGSEQE